MPWRERFHEYLLKEKELLQLRLDNFHSRRCEMWENVAGNRKDVSEEYAAALRSRIAEIEQLLVEEDLS